MNTHFETLTKHLIGFANLNENDVSESRPLWKLKKVGKGDCFNMKYMVWSEIGLVVMGIFRVYIVDVDTGLEKNLYFFSENQFLVSFRSHISQKNCNYYIQAMEESEIIYMAYGDLDTLYQTGTKWVMFGKTLAELFFKYSQTRTEELLFIKHEKRFLRLLEEHPNIVNRIRAYHISSYLGITNPSLSRIRKRINR
ncbi:Crp/Fnr family transcriptional regulator [Pedobacter miscanthi]|uniref:Crp/Fnr family transcriptional regulator n=1 Tax=Pedobacter miscanthi TaxID=2259170 RepID=UPI00293068F1|nr:Crp/Fnr family transcriptional regulator [Pedobacter miscanthi]